MRRTRFIFMFTTIPCVFCLPNTWSTAKYLLRYKKLGKEKGYRDLLSDLDIQIICKIAIDCWYLYLDKISNELYKRTGSIHWYHNSTIWQVLQKIGYSLQVVTNRTWQQDKEERALYKRAINTFILDPSLAFFLTRKSKDVNCAQQHRHWSKK